MGANGPPPSYAPRTGRGAIGWPAPLGHPNGPFNSTLRSHPRALAAMFGQPTNIEPRDYIFVKKTTGRSVESLV
jgi:hypothetical protein